MNDSIRNVTLPPNRPSRPEKNETLKIAPHLSPVRPNVNPTRIATVPRRRSQSGEFYGLSLSRADQWIPDGKVGISRLQHWDQ